MALSKDRSGRIHGPILVQQDFHLPNDGEIFLGGMYRVVAGMLAIPADDAAQDDCITVYALQHKSNKGGQDRAVRARCMVKGSALVAKGSLSETDIGKPVYPTTDDAIAATVSEASNQPIGTLLAIDGQLATVQL